MPYRAPVSDYRFIMDQIAGFGQVSATETFTDATADMADAILTEAGKLCEDVIAPLQRPGDLYPAHLENGVVRTSPGFAEGYQAIAEGGWIGMAANPEFGGMGLPMTLTTAVNEMLASACLSLQLNPLMTQGQIEALEHHALTEPQAGSDVGALRSKAEPNDDGSYAISGQKIYISWADNDFTDNVCHLVLARLPDGVPGTKGISLFMVPKFIPDPDGTLGKRNSLRVVSLEHKMGLHGSPTAVMEYDNAKGWLVGPAHGGMAAMFTMMNNARLGVGVQGVGAAEGALQHALAYATERKQGKTGGTGTIIEHADVRRMLAEMKADVFTARAIALMNAVAIDMSTATDDPVWSSRAALLTPISKAFGTDVGVEIAAKGIQVHGGMGFVEETGAAQYARDVRVTTIYEGTNGIQAMDLVARKMMDGGDAAYGLIEEIEAASEAAKPALPDLAQDVWSACENLREATEWLVGQDLQDRFAGAVPYLRAFARVLGGHAHLCAALTGDETRKRLATFYIKRMLPEHQALLTHVREGADDLMAISPDDLAA